MRRNNNFCLVLLAIISLFTAPTAPTDVGATGHLWATVPTEQQGLPNFTPASPLSGRFYLADVVAIAAGYHHTCALTRQGGVKCWGDNGYGQLGDGSTENSSLARNVSDLSRGVTTIAAGYRHTCAVLASGQVMCWGWNEFGQLGDGTQTSSTVPVTVLGLTDAVEVTAGGNHTCARTANGSTLCWGLNSSGQLGDGFGTQLSSTPRSVVGLASGVSDIAAGFSHTCAVVQGGVQCWGKNHSGQLGDGSRIEHRGTPGDVMGLAGVVIAVALGDAHSCALGAAGDVHCWGANHAGQLGDGTWEQASSVPHAVIGLANATAITTGAWHTCALNHTRDTLCWGLGSAGQLGDGSDSTQTNVPRTVIGLASPLIAVSGGYQHTCGISATGRAMCWGSDSSGQRGDGPPELRATPRDVSELPSQIVVVAAGDDHTCALAWDGVLRCWGSNWAGQLGRGSTGDASGQPAPVVGLTNPLVAVSAGNAYTCGITANGEARCWGYNYRGQLGDGTSTPWNPSPRAPVGLTTGVTTIAAGAGHACALMTDGVVKCWGDNRWGQLGRVTAGGNSNLPADVVGLADRAVDITAGASHTCTLLADDSLQCWGNNSYGQLGDGTTESRGVPRAVAGLERAVTAVTAGGQHTCALQEGGAVVCWGEGLSGQLGDGKVSYHSLVPVDVVGLSSGTLSVIAGAAHTCAILTGGGAKCWGSNWEGQLGDGGAEPFSSVPQEVVSLTTRTAGGAAGRQHTCAVLQGESLASGGRVRCWGDNTSGRLGLGTATLPFGPAYVVSDIPASLLLNYSNGRPGSIFTLTGENFPPDTTVAIVVNGQTLENALPVLPSGDFVLFLAAEDGLNGDYGVTVSGYAGAIAQLHLRDWAPIRRQEGGGQTIALSGVVPVQFRQTFLPVVGLEIPAAPGRR